MRLHHYIATAVATAAAVNCLTACTPPVSPAALTIAVSGTSHEPAVDVATIAGVVTAHAMNALFPGDGVVKVVVQGRPSVAVDLTPMRGRDVESDLGTADELIKSKLGGLADAMNVGAASDGTNTLGVLDQAIQVTPAGGTIVLISSGISTVDPIDLTRAGDWIGEPDAFAARISGTDLPDATGRNLVYAGIGYGDPDGVQATAGPAPRAALRIIWQAVCKSARAASCAFIDGPAGTAASKSANAVPVVLFDQVVTNCVGTTVVPADVTFEPDSAKLNKKTADKILKPIAEALAKCPSGARVDAFGHAATVPGAGDGVKLSTRRAQAVLDRLVALGVPKSAIGKAVGYGSKSHQPVNNMPGGKYDAELAKLNRTVELVITTR